MTRQEMFDRAVRGLREQGFRRCVDRTGACVYSDGNGNHCAWGWIDTTLDPHIEGSVMTLRSHHLGVAAKLSDEDVAWATNLQSTHDSSTELGEMEPKLRKFAEHYGLTFPEPEVSDA